MIEEIILDFCYSVSIDQLSDINGQRSNVVSLPLLESALIY